MRLQRVQQARQPALHVIDAGSVGAAVGNAERALARGAGGKDRVVVTDEEDALRPGARLDADDVIAEPVLREARYIEAKALERLHEQFAGIVDVVPVIGPAVLVDEARQEVDLRLLPLVEKSHQLAHLFSSGSFRRPQIHGGAHFPRGGATIARSPTAAGRRRSRAS